MPRLRLGRDLHGERSLPSPRPADASRRGGSGGRPAAGRANGAGAAWSLVGDRAPDAREGGHAGGGVREGDRRVGATRPPAAPCSISGWNFAGRTAAAATLATRNGF